jgi:thiol-disulfide isomerase/thioredoxin
VLRHSIIFLLSICHLTSSICHSQNVTIKGKVDASYLSDAVSIYAYTYDDYISYREKELANGPIDAKGNFSLSVPVSGTTYVFLTVDNAKAELIVEPDKIYDIDFSAKDPGAVNMLGMSVPVEIEFNNSDTSELNYLMADFSNRYEAFLEYHQPEIAKKIPVLFGEIDTMKMLCMEKYSKKNKPYLNTYINYTFASLEESLTLKDKEKMLDKYITGKPVLLNNYDYMSFFNQFFSVSVNYFMSNGKTQAEINSKQIFSSLKELFRQSKLLPNDTICEAVLLKSLSEYYRYPGYKVNAVLAILDQAGTQCKAEANRRAAQNLKKKLSVMNPGKPAPSLVFQDKDGKEVSLADFKGRYVYLNFWATWCASCTQEMTLIPDLKKQYGGKIIFVSISVDKKMDAMKNFLKKNPKLDPDKNGAGWNFLYCDNYKKAKEEFNVLTVPSYYLIDPKGNVMKAPAPNPVDIEDTFIQIKQRR